MTNATTQAMRMDHAVINVRHAMDAAHAQCAALGFTLTPRGHHSLGSINHLMMFGSDYLELIGLPAGGESQRAALLSAPLGINGLVFKSDDVDRTFARLQGLDMAGDPPLSFHRPVALADGARDARFRTVTARTDRFPAGRVYFCEHRTPDLVWRPEWQTHANGARRIGEMVIVSETPAASAVRYASLTGSTASSGNGRALGVQTADIRLTILSPAEYRDRYGALASPMNGRAEIFGAVVIETATLDAVRAIAAADEGLPALARDDGIALRLADFDAVLDFTG